MEETFEKLLWSTRYIVLLAVFSSLAAMLLLFVLSAMDMVHLVSMFIDVTFLGVEHEDFHVTAVSHIITAVDDFLLAIVLLIFAMGMYELFISDIDVAREERNAAKILMIHSLDDLKDRLGKVILMILIVAFFKNVLHVHFDDPLNILYMGAGIFFVSLASYFSHKAGSHDKP